MNKKGVTMLEVTLSIVIISTLIISIFPFINNSYKSTDKNKQNATIQSYEELVLHELSKISTASIDSFIGTDDYKVLDKSNCSSLSNIVCENIFDITINDYEISTTSTFIYLYNYKDNDLVSNIKKSDVDNEFYDYIKNDFSDIEKDNTLKNRATIITYLKDVSGVRHEII